MRKIITYMAPYKWFGFIAILLMFIELGVELVQPLIIGKIIDQGIVNGDVQVIWTWGLAMFGMGILAFIAGISNGFFASHAAQSFSYDLRVGLFKKVQSLSMENFLKIPTSSLITRMTNDVTQVQNVFFMLFRFMLRAPLFIVGSFILAFLVNVQLALILAAGVPFLLVFLWFMTKNGAKKFRIVQVSIDRVNRRIQENLQATRLVKAYMRGLYEESRFEKLVHTLKTDTMKALRMMERIQPVLLIVMNMALLVVVWFGAKKIEANEIPVGDIVTIFNYAMRITGNFGMFAMLITFVSRAFASANRMAEVLEMSSGEHEKQQYVLDERQKEGYIVMDRVSFSYPSTSKEVLKSVSFTCQKGDTIAIMGATGSGKSSLLQLLPRLYNRSEGHIYLDGKQIEQWPVEQLRQEIGYVPQRSLLFTGTIFENVTWGKSDATMEEVIEACKAAQIHSSIEQFPDGYYTRVGQKGVNLSGGQKQRLAIARALIRKPKILLFDDSMSALDMTTERKLWEALQSYDATMFVVTQKIATASTANQILLLQDGMLVAQGTHEQLLKEVPLYEKIVESQQEVSNDV